LIRLFGGLRKPKDPRVGIDVAGWVEAVGNNVTQFQPGDEVFGGCKGSFAEYAIAREKGLAFKPANSTFEQAAAAPVGAITALQGLRDSGHIQPGQTVLIYGASGSVGTFAVQIAKSFGTEVTAVCSTRNLEMARSIGADHVIDYTQEDFTRYGQQYDLILAINGYHPIFTYKRALNPTGIYVMAGASSTHIFPALFQAIFLGPLISRTGKQKMGFMGIAKINQKDLVYIKGLFEAGKIKSVIEKRYPLSETIEALRYVGGGHARAKVIITVEQDNHN
jgi:NADPH:quinone reductase-like Zn-dependent oxidoreductase